MAGKYMTEQGDTFESIAWAQMGSSRHMTKLIYANEQYMETAIFEAGIVLDIPDVDNKEPVDESATPPWRRKR